MKEKHNLPKLLEWPALMLFCQIASLSEAKPVKFKASKRDLRRETTEPRRITSILGLSPFLPVFEFVIMFPGLVAVICAAAIISLLVCRAKFKKVQSAVESSRLNGEKDVDSVESPDSSSNEEGRKGTRPKKSLSSKSSRQAPSTSKRAPVTSVFKETGLFETAPEQGPSSIPFPVAETAERNETTSSHSIQKLDPVDDDQDQHAQQASGGFRRIMNMFKRPAVEKATTLQTMNLEEGKVNAVQGDDQAYTQQVNKEKMKLKIQTLYSPSKSNGPEHSNGENFKPSRESKSQTPKTKKKLTAESAEKNKITDSLVDPELLPPRKRMHTEAKPTHKEEEEDEDEDEEEDEDDDADFDVVSVSGELIVEQTIASRKSPTDAKTSFFKKKLEHREEHLKKGKKLKNHVDSQIISAEKTHQTTEISTNTKSKKKTSSPFSKVFLKSKQKEVKDQNIVSESPELVPEVFPVEEVKDVETGKVSEGIVTGHQDISSAQVLTSTIEEETKRSTKTASKRSTKTASSRKSANDSGKPADERPRSRSRSASRKKTTKKRSPTPSEHNSVTEVKSITKSTKSEGSLPKEASETVVDEVSKPPKDPILEDGGQEIPASTEPGLVGGSRVKELKMKLEANEEKVTSP